MWATFVIAGAFFVALLAAGYFGMKQREEEARELAKDGGEPADGARGLTSDDVVHQLERRIDEEMREVSYDMRAPERYRRAFER